MKTHFNWNITQPKMTPKQIQTLFNIVNVQIKIKEILPTRWPKPITKTISKYPTWVYNQIRRLESTKSSFIEELGTKYKYFPVILFVYYIHTKIILYLIKNKLEVIPNFTSLVKLIIIRTWHKILN